MYKHRNGRMNEEPWRSILGHTGAWMAAIIGGLSFEVWIALAGLLLSGILALTNYRSRKLQDRLLLDEAKRSEELHELEVERLRRGLGIDPARTPTCVQDLVGGNTQLTQKPDRGG